MRLSFLGLGLGRPFATQQSCLQWHTTLPGRWLPSCRPQQWLVPLCSKCRMWNLTRAPLPA